MNDFSKIQYFDLRLAASQNRLPYCIGRLTEMDRIARIACKHVENNVILVGPSGIGKTALVYGWAKKFANSPALKHLQIVQLDSGNLSRAGIPTGTLFSRYHEAFAGMPNSIVFIDDFGQMIYSQPQALHAWTNLLKPIAEKNSSRLILTFQPRELEWAQAQSPAFFNHFETIQLQEQIHSEQVAILAKAAAELGKPKLIHVPGESLSRITHFTKRFPTLGTMPKSGILILDEAIASATSHNNTSVSPETVELIVSEKAKVPMQKLKEDEKDNLKKLKYKLDSGVIGQTQATESIASVIQRARLGLKSNSRPLGSFLMLGPSGTGKTETAKLLAQELFGTTGGFLRIDMSEFTEAHAVHRLIGSPPGYTGSDAGGQLTNHIKNNPYTLILLDEIEKAHPKIFDIFLQLLDDGRLTSSQGETVDCTQLVVMATSNLGVEKIISHFTKGGDIHSKSFYEQVIIPVLSSHFRLEFINRFDDALVYKPLTQDDLTEIALLEIKKIEERVKKHRISFDISKEMLALKISQLADPRFGARPVKRFIEETCEGLIAQQLLNQ